MIELSYTRAALLAAIEAADPATLPLSEITDPCVATGDARVRVCGREKDDLFPLLKIALSERFADVPRPQLNRDLLIPLRNALGNAFKHGNSRDPAKSVSVEIMLSGKGALVAVTDQGAGFDVALTFRRFQERQSYFMNHGVGFRNLHQAMSLVSYENGGRTMLLCFRPRDESDSPAAWAFGDAAPIAPGESPSEGHPLHEPDPLIPSFSPNGREGARRAGDSVGFMVPMHGRKAEEALHDSNWIQSRLSAELPDFGSNETRIESCRVYAARGRSADDCGDRYVLKLGNLSGGLADTRILTGRLHATAAAAAADFEAATRLREARISKRVLIPRPLARLADQPRLVLYEFDPWMNLWEYLAERRSLNSLRHSAERFGQALAGLHRSQIVCSRLQPDAVGEQFEAIIARAQTTLQTLSSGPDWANRFRICGQRLLEQAPFSGQCVLTPIHGAFGWDCIHYGVDSRFYVFRFENCRRSHPGLDLGGYAADLLCFTLAHHDEGVYRLGLDTLLSNYNSNAEHTISEEALRFFIALALCQRLQRAHGRQQANAGRLLQALDATLSGKGAAGASEAS